MQTLAPQRLRKNFTLSPDAVKELEFLAEQSQKKQSHIIQELIHQASEERRHALRLQKLKQLKGIFTGMLGDGQSIQTMKADRQL